MAGKPKAQVDTDAAPGSAAASPAKAVEHLFGSPPATSRSASMPSPTMPSLPLTVEDLSATVHQLMRAMEDQRIKLEEQAKTIASWEAGIAAAEGESTAAAEAEWGDDHEGHQKPADRILGGVGTTKAGWPTTPGAILQDSWNQLPRLNRREPALKPKEVTLV